MSTGTITTKTGSDARRVARIKKFAGLNKVRPLRPIRNNSDYSRVRAIADNLVLLPKRSADQEDYLNTLFLLMADYERGRWEIDTSKRKPLDLLKYLLDENAMTASDLGRLLGQRQLGSKILRGQRELSKDHIRKLAERFNVAAGLFI